MTPTPPHPGERAEASALTRAREYLAGIQTDGYRYDHPITILGALVAEIDAAPVGRMYVDSDDDWMITPDADDPDAPPTFRHVRLLALDSGGAGEVGS